GHRGQWSGAGRLQQHPRLQQRQHLDHPDGDRPRSRHPSPGPAPAEQRREHADPGLPAGRAGG
ncbi:MAG: hypothetical protein ACK559_01070, partial [bacterium]